MLNVYLNLVRFVLCSMDDKCVTKHKQIIICNILIHAIHSQTPLKYPTAGKISSCFLVRFLGYTTRLKNKEFPLRHLLVSA